MRQKLEAIREQSCYPAFRGFVSFFTIVGYMAVLLGMLIGLIAMMKGGASGVMAGILVIAGSVVFGLVVKAAAECSLMLADIADCTVQDASMPASSVPSAGPQQAAPASAQPVPASTPAAPVQQHHEPTLAELMQQGPASPPTAPQSGQ